MVPSDRPRAGRARALLPCLLLVLSPACFDRSYPANLPCGPDSTCPPGQTCDGEGVCRRSFADADTDASDLVDAGCPTQTVTVLSVADGIFSGPGAGEDQPKGTFDIANIGVGIQSRGIFRFNIAALPVGATVIDGALVLTPAPRSEGCGADCGSCSGIESDGTMIVHFLRSDWDEETFTYILRNTGQEWGAAGAAAIGVDRSGPVGQASHAAGQELSLSFRGVEIGTWRDGNQLSLLVDPSDGGVIVAATREAGGCPGVYPAPTLTLRYCVDIPPN